MTGFQYICGMYVVLHGGVSGKVPCPQCGTEWSEDSVRLFDGTIYCLGENGRWIRGADKPKRPPVPVPVSRFFGEEK